MGDGIRDLAGEEPGEIRPASCKLRGETVKVDSEAEHAGSVVRAELCDECGKDPSEDIACAALAQAGIAR